jgi:hypothetical protein
MISAENLTEPSTVQSSAMGFVTQALGKQVSTLNPSTIPKGSRKKEEAHTLNSLKLKQPDSYSKKKNYIFEEILGSGSFGFVKKAVWIPHGNLPVAVKCIKKK